MPSSPSSSSWNRPRWTRLLPVLSDGQVPPAFASLLPLLAPSIATMGMGAVSSHSDLTSLQTQQHQQQHQQQQQQQQQQHDVTTSSTTSSCSSMPDYSPCGDGMGHTLVFGSTLKSCAVCLEDYRPGDRLRLLDPCGHCFHVACVDEWFDAPVPSGLPYLACPVCKAHVALHRPPKPIVRHSRTASSPSARDIRAPHHASDTATAATTTEPHPRQPWAHVQLIDLSVHQSWVEWFSELVHLYSANAATLRRRV